MGAAKSAPRSMSGVTAGESWKTKQESPARDQDQLRRKAAELEAVFDSLADGLLIVDDAVQIVGVDRSIGASPWPYRPGRAAGLRRHRCCAPN